MATTIQVRRSPAGLPASNAWLWRKAVRSWIAMTSILGPQTVPFDMQFPALLAAFAIGAAPADDPGPAHAHSHHGAHGSTVELDGWTLSGHGFVNAIYDYQGSRRGDEKTFSNSMFMGTAEGPWLAGSIELRGMLSLDPAMGKGGYPLLFQTGETANGVTHLVDRQHPHDFFM